MYELDGRVAIVTGAAGFIGSHTAKVLADAGATVVVTDLPGTPLDAVAQAIKDAGHESLAFAGDITQEENVVALMAATKDAFGRLDIIDNNAGATGMVRYDHPVTELDVAVWDQILAINARAPMMMCKHGIPLMLERGKGAIVNISSGKALAGDHDGMSYAAGKAAVNVITQYVATRYGKKGIRANSVCPGLIVKDSTRAAFPGRALEVYEMNSLVTRLGEPGDIAAAVLFLVSDAAAFINGEIISVDGGHHNHQPHWAEFNVAMGIN
jgi:NAD(P)-dependent dehydrogenase (short-subunit alcohol dehydrogenase family)